VDKLQASIKIAAISGSLKFSIVVIGFYSEPRFEVWQRSEYYSK